MKVIFSHGMESGPWGTKIQRLARIAEQRGLEVESVDYTDTLDPDIRVGRLLQILNEESGDCVLVGSSMGGYVALTASINVPVRAAFLMAPALYIPGYKVQAYPSKADSVHIVHGWKDDVIPPENSIRFARESGHNLHLLDGNHALGDVLEGVDRLFELFLEQILN